MPELPEVEVVRRALEARVVGRRILAVEVGRERTVRRTSAEAVVDGLTGTTITVAERRGKYLVCSLDSGDALMIHLRMSGRLVLAPVTTPRPPHTHVVLALAEPGVSDERPGSAHRADEELRFIDPRTFGEVVVFDPDNVAAEVPELGRLGPDPIADGLTTHDLRRVLAGRARPLKALLLDQRSLAGLGNIYSDEVLHRSRLRFDRPAGSVGPRQITVLHAALMEVLEAAIEAGGSTLADAQYVGLSGEAGRYQHAHRVYAREGAPCARCGARSAIVRVRYAGRSTFFCPRCQR